MIGVSNESGANVTNSHPQASYATQSNCGARNWQVLPSGDVAVTWRLHDSQLLPCMLGDCGI